MKAQRLFGLALVLALLAGVRGAIGASLVFSAHETVGRVLGPTPLRSLYPMDSSLCPPLAPPTGNVVNVSTVAELQSAVNSAFVGDTILVCRWGLPSQRSLPAI
jgi:hypothetical protein